MALQLSRAVSDGIRRTLSRTGAVLFLALLVLQFGIQTSINSALLGYLPAEAAAEFSSDAGLTLPVSGGVGLALFAAFTVLSSAYFVVVSRTLAQPLAEMSTFPAGVTDRLGRATFTALVGGLIVTVAVTVGFAFLIVPGLFLAASFLFFVFAVAVEDRGVVGSLERSWELSRGSRLKLGLLVALSAAFGGVLGVLAPLLILAGAPVAADVLTVVLSAAFFLPYYGIIASAYRQLRDGGPGTGGRPSQSVDPSRTPEL